MPIGAPIIDEIAAANAIVKFGFEAIAALIVSFKNKGCCCWPSGCGILWGKMTGCPSSWGIEVACNGRRDVRAEEVSRCSCIGLVVMSRVIVGNGADVERVAIGM